MNENPVTDAKSQTTPRKRTILWILVAVVLYVTIQTLFSKGVIG